MHQRAARWSATALLCASLTPLQAHQAATQAAPMQTLGEASSPSAPFGLRAHEHGMADLAIAQDGVLWWLQLQLPLADLVGFERLPRDTVEADSVLAAVRALAEHAFQLDYECTTESAAANLEPGGEIDLKLGKVPQTSPSHDQAQAQANHGHSHDHGEGLGNNGELGGHVDLILTRTYRCAPPGPSGLTLTWPAAAGAQPRVRAQWLLESGQGGAELRSTDQQLRWRRHD